MSYEKLQLECISCQQLFSYFESDASTQEQRTIYCSALCEQTEEAKLAEGNAIVRKAIEAEPLAFAKTVNWTPQMGEVQKITDVVDGVMDRLGIGRKD